MHSILEGIVAQAIIIIAVKPNYRICLLDGVYLRIVKRLNSALSLRVNGILLATA